jgi:hypothetical protein
MVSRPWYWESDLLQRGEGIVRGAGGIWMSLADGGNGHKQDVKQVLDQYRDSPDQDVIYVDGMTKRTQRNGRR